MTDQDITNGDIVKEDQVASRIAIEETIEWATTIFQTLFELEKKYSRSIKKKEVVHVREAEEDRSKVSDAYLYLKTQKENLIDSALYEDFIDMNELKKSDKAHLKALSDQTNQKNIGRLEDLQQDFSKKNRYKPIFGKIRVINKKQK